MDVALSYIETGVFVIMEFALSGAEVATSKVGHGSIQNDKNHNLFADGQFFGETYGSTKQQNLHLHV